MSFFTRPELTDEQFKQLSTSVLTLSGETDFVGVLKSKGVEIDASTGGTFAGYVLTLDPSGVIILKSGGTGTGLYGGDSPSTIAVGGIPAGYELTGKTFEQLWEKMLVVFQEPQFTTFTNNISSLNQVGNPASWSGSKLFTWNTSNGGNVSANTITINDVTNTIIVGTGLANDGSENLPLGTTITNNVPLSNTWNIEGINTELNPIPVDTYSIETIYPWFYGTFDGGAVAAGVNRPDATVTATTQALLSSGSTVVQKSNGTLSVANFGAGIQDYLWFAIPSSFSVAKNKWFVTSLNNGAIGGAVSAGGNLFPDPDTVVVDSPDGYWTGISYNIYVSNKQVATTNMEFRNS